MRLSLRGSVRSWAVLISLLPLLWMGPSAALADHHMNPCKAKTANPCDAKRMNPCNPCGAGQSVAPERFKQPAGVRLQRGSNAALLAEGEKLWNDPKLGKSGLACATCHIDNYTLMQSTFSKPYPHEVAMPKQMGGVNSVNAAEMVNFCMIVPMKDEPLDWKSRELAALTRYVEHIRRDYRQVGSSGRQVGSSGTANPCNPCSRKANACNPCSKKANPCGSKEDSGSWWKFW